MLSARRGQPGQGTATIGRGLYVERLTAVSTAAARKCLLITCKIIIPPPDSGDAPRLWTHAWNGMQHGQCGQGTTSIGRALYMQRLTAGSTAAAGKCLLITRKIFIPPPNSRDPPDGPPYFAKKTSPPLPARTHQLYLRTQGSASLLRTKKMNTPPISWDPV